MKTVILSIVVFINLSQFLFFKKKGTNWTI